MASQNPRTCNADTALTYTVDYRSAPPVFSVFPASDLVDHEGKPMYGPEFLETSDDAQRIVHAIVHNGLDPRKPAVSIEVISASTFSSCLSAMPATFNPERARGTDQEGNALAVQCDSLDTVMVDAIYGRALKHDEFHFYAMHSVHPRYETQEKTIFERLEEVVKRRKERNQEPCCRDYSNESVGFVGLY